MKLLIVDTNLIFSAALNLERPIGKFIMIRANQDIKFYAPEYLRIEIERHFPRIVEVSKSTEQSVRNALNYLYDKLTFISDDQIPFEYYQQSIPYVKEVDMDDLIFVALNEYLDCLLWTGDTKLYEGLRAKGYNKVVNFQDIKNMFEMN